jgi:hypothetical protein
MLQVTTRPVPLPARCAPSSTDATGLYQDFASCAATPGTVTESGSTEMNPSSVLNPVAKALAAGAESVITEFAA